MFKFSFGIVDSKMPVNALLGQSFWKKPKGVTFKVTTAAGEFVPDESSRISSNGFYNTDANGRITISDLNPGSTVTAREVQTVEG